MFEQRPARALFVLIGLAVLLWLVGIGIGSRGWEGWAALRDDPATQQIVWQIRLPRTLGAWAAGALLGLAGAIAQGLFRNPLADPYLLGSASGASLAVALSMALFGVSPLATWWVVRLGLTGVAFAGATLAVLLTLTLASGVQQTLRLLLSGVIVGVVLGALTNLVATWVPGIMAAQQAFLLGGTGFVGWSSALLMIVVWFVCASLAWMLSPVLDALSLGESTTLSLGLPLPALRGSLIGLLALATGSAVAQTGLIAFVGLAAPHLTRAIVRARHRWTMWLASLTGGVLLCAADLLARWVLSPREVPVGALTAVLGGSYLLWRMHRLAGSARA